MLVLNPGREVQKEKKKNRSGVWHSKNRKEKDYSKTLRKRLKHRRQTPQLTVNTRPKPVSVSNGNQSHRVDSRQREKDQGVHQMSKTIFKQRQSSSQVQPCEDTWAGSICGWKLQKLFCGPLNLFCHILLKEHYIILNVDARLFGKQHKWKE